MSNKILQTIFSIKNSADKTHKTITILGLRLNIRRLYPPIIVPYEKIRMVEIEIFSYCNRKCWFCPNSFIDRHSQNILMEEALYLNILNDLKKFNYSRTISYSRYNEPTSHKEVFIKRIKQAHQYLPNATLHTNTNGDYLNREYLDELYNAGLRSMNIQCYLNKDEEFDIEHIKKRIDNTAKKLNIEYQVVCKLEDRYEVTFLYKDMKLNMYARNFRTNGNNRGGTLDTIKPFSRKCPCYIPFTDIYIDYNGKVMPCCNFRSDIKEHEKFIVGNVNKESILKIFNNETIKRLRKELRHNNIKIKPCCQCNFALINNEVLK